MRTAIGIFLFVAGLVIVGVAVSGERIAAYGQAPGGHRAAPSAPMIALTSDGPDGFQQLTLIDTAQRVMSVYHVDRATGRVALKSVRNVNWDLQMEEFNGSSPTPREIQSLLRPRR